MCIRDRFEPGSVRGPVLGFESNRADPAVLMRPEAVAAYERAFEVWNRDERIAAEEALERARRAQAPPLSSFTGEIVRLQARLAHARGAWAQADSLNQLDLELSGPSAGYFGLRALLLLEAGDRAGAAEAAARCLAIRPDDFEGLTAQEALRTGSVTPRPGEAGSGSRSPF